MFGSHLRATAPATLLLAILTVLAALVGTRPAHAAPIVINGCPFEVNGDLWMLTADCEATGTLELPLGATLDGDHHKISVIASWPSGDPIIHVAGPGTDLTSIQNLRIDGTTSSNLFITAIYIEGGAVRIVSNHIRMRAVLAGGITIHDGENVEMSNNVIIGSSPIAVFGFRGATIRNNRLTNTNDTSSAIRVEDGRKALIADNTASPPMSGPCNSVFSQDVLNITVQGNTFSGCTFGVTLLSRSKALRQVVVAENTVTADLRGIAVAFGSANGTCKPIGKVVFKENTVHEAGNQADIAGITLDGTRQGCVEELILDATVTGNKVSGWDRGKAFNVDGVVHLQWTGNTVVP